MFYCTTIAYHVELNADLRRPMSKKNRHLVLTETSGCPLVAFLLILLFSHWPHDLKAFANFAFCIHIFYYFSVYTYRWMFYLAVKVKVQQDKYFLSFLLSVSFGSGLHGLIAVKMSPTKQAKINLDPLSVATFACLSTTTTSVCLAENLGLKGMTLV